MALVTPASFDPPPPAPAPGTRPWRRTLVALLAAWLLVVSGFALVASWGHPRQRAVIGMAWGLILLWVGAGGWAMRRWEAALARMGRSAPGPWPVKFYLGCVLGALAEEAVTTGMTNCAPLFGVRRGEAYITASANYLDVVLHHSVVVFLPMFLGWILLLRWWRFTPFAVFLLWGLTGTLLEFAYSGWRGVPNVGFWVFVYGLMVWIPAHWVPEDRPARRPPIWAYPWAVLFPPLLLPLDFILAPWLWLEPMLRHAPHHPDVHFPPLPV